MKQSQGFLSNYTIQREIQFSNNIDEFYTSFVRMSKFLKWQQCTVVGNDVASLNLIQRSGMKVLLLVNNGSS